MTNANEIEPGRCYLAGPMRGYPEFNFPAFHAASAVLREKGWEVFSPAERDEDDEWLELQQSRENAEKGVSDVGLAYFMQYDLAAVCNSQAVFLLPGWRESQGARLEVHVALEVGVPVFEIETGSTITSLSGSTLQEVLPVGSQARKDIPLTTGVLDYFPAALAEVARVSKQGNDKHNPGQELHWARGKSMDHANCIGRHLLERGSIDPDTGQRHSAQLAWRSLALLQQELEAEGLAPISRGSWEYAIEEAE